MLSGEYSAEDGVGGWLKVLARRLKPCGCESPGKEEEEGDRWREGSRRFRSPVELWHLRIMRKSNVLRHTQYNDHLNSINV